MLKTIEETYRERLQMLIDEYGGQATLAAIIGKSPTQISQWRNGSPDSKTGKPRSIKSDTAREIERILGKPHAWFDQPVQAEEIVNVGTFSHIEAGGVQNNIGKQHNNFYHQESIRSDKKMPDQSMFPVIPEGSPLWTDTSDTVMQNGKTYLVEYGGLQAVRRLFAEADGQIRLKPYHADYSETTLPAEQVQIIGRVVRWCVED